MRLTTRGKNDKPSVSGFCVFMKKRKKEIWSMITGYHQLYWVSSWGNVKNRHGHIMNEQETNGYLYISLCKFGVKKDFRINRLVALHFVPNTENKPYVNHKDTDKQNNYYKNLEWSTQKENINHAVKHGRIKIGENSPYAKLTNKDVLEIFKSTGSTDVVGAAYGVCGQTIRAIKTGLRWSEVTGKEYVQKRKYTKDEILYIFNSNLSAKELAKMFEMKEPNVWGIKIGKVWGSVTGKIYKPVKYLFQKSNGRKCKTEFSINNKRKHRKADHMTISIETKIS